MMRPQLDAMMGEIRTGKVARVVVYKLDRLGFERSFIRERVNAGLRVAKGRDVKLGRPSTLAGRREEDLQLRVQGVGLRAAAACRASGPATTR